MVKPAKYRIDDLAEAFVEGGQALEGFVDGEHLLGAALGELDAFLQGELAGLVEGEIGFAAAALSGLLPPGIIDEDLAHGSGRHAEEVRPVFPGRIGMFDELEVGFVHQRRGVERVVFALEIYHLLSTSRKTALIGLFSGIPTDKPP